MSDIAIIKRLLAERAIDVCRHYLSNGHRVGRYWQVGDVHNAKGTSLFVRLAPPGEVGKWNDAATRDHGDLLDIIQLSQSIPDLPGVLREARQFLDLPTTPQTATNHTSDHAGVARRLFQEGLPIPGTLAERYLHSRKLTVPRDHSALRFHPKIRLSHNDYHPAMLAAVQDNTGAITGISRYFLRPDASLIARRALGKLNGRGVWIGSAPFLIIGEGLENTLSVPLLYPQYQRDDIALVATLSASHMAAFQLPETVIRFVIATDNDATGREAAEALQARYPDRMARLLIPSTTDFNAQLMAQS